MSSTTLDADYIRATGNEVYEQLFPRPKKDGTPVIPLPYAVNYTPGDGIEFEILFVPERIIKRATGEDVPDAPPTWVRVILDNRSYTINLAFGEEPGGTDGLGDTPEALALLALLQATAGVLE